MEDIIGKDRFGNEYTDTIWDNGQIVRCTQTNRNTMFEFMGDTYSWDYLNSLPTIKEYVDDYHQQMNLCKDKYGRLLLYFYDEYMNFGGGDDREDYLWVVVGDENDADELSEAHRFGRLRIPYIAADENEWMAAHQFIEEKKYPTTVYDIGSATTDFTHSDTVMRNNDNLDDRIIIIETPGLNED